MLEGSFRSTGLLLSDRYSQVTMDNLNTRILAVADLDRVPMIETLIALDAHAQARARTGRHARLGTVTRNRADEARGEAERLGRIIYFLRFRSQPSALTDEDARLCDILATKLQAKGQWAGEYSL
jgi:hypothetical protein